MGRKLIYRREVKRRISILKVLSKVLHQQKDEMDENEIRRLAKGTRTSKLENYYTYIYLKIYIYS